jgi:hypothetical protein
VLSGQRDRDQLPAARLLIISGLLPRRLPAAPPRLLPAFLLLPQLPVVTQF